MLRFKGLFALLVSFFAIYGSSVAQIEDPVQWEITVEDASETAATLVFTATIEDKWHVYATVVSEDEKAQMEGPMPTSIEIEPSENYTADGGLQDTDFTTHADPVFGFDLNYYDAKATFKQRVKLNSSDPFFVTGALSFMACDEEKCIFPDPFPFKVAMNGAKESAGIFEPVKWTIASKDLGNGEYQIDWTATADEHWHVYALSLPSNEGPFPTEFAFSDSSRFSFQGGVTEPEYINEYDPNFMMDLYFHEEVTTFSQIVKPNGDKKVAEGTVYFMTCDDERCLPPKELRWKIDLASGKGKFLADGEDVEGEAQIFDENEDPFVISGVDLENPVNKCADGEGEMGSVEGDADEPEEQSLWMTFLLGLGGGLLALLTPCVFPMIPLTVSFFTKGSEGKNGKVRAAIYGFFILMIYVLLSLPFHLSKNVDPEILNQISTNPWLNISFFVIFVVFAISFFGYFEITLPSGLANKVDGASNAGGLVGIFFMALTLAIVSFSCTGPVLGGLIGSIYSGDVVGTASLLGLEVALPAAKVTSAMAGFGLALGGPFALFAAFPSLMNSLPKSGGWLNVVKVCLGFAELALAFKFLSNADLVVQAGLLKREIFFAIWIVIGVAWVIYMLGGIRFPHDSPNAKIGKGRWTTAILVGAFVIYLIPGLTKGEAANRKLLSGFPPPLWYSIYDKTHGFTDYDEALAYAKEVNKPLLVDFTGWACVNCRRMEENVWVDPAIQKMLTEDYVVVSLYVDEKVAVEKPFIYETRDGRKKEIKTVGNHWSTLQVETFNANSQPMYALLSTDEQLLAPVKAYTPDIAIYTDWLKCGLDANQTVMAKSAK